MLVVLGAQQDLDAALLHLLGQVGAHVVVEAAQDVGAAMDQGRLDAQAVEDAGELHGDIAAADDHDPLGQLGRWKASFEVMACSMPGRSCGIHGRPPVAIRILSAVTVCAWPLDLDGVGVDQRGALPWTSSAPAFCRLADVDARQPGDLVVLGRQEARPVEASASPTSQP